MIVFKIASEDLVILCHRCVAHSKQGQIWTLRKVWEAFNISFTIWDKYSYLRYFFFIFYFFYQIEVSFRFYAFKMALVKGSFYPDPLSLVSPLLSTPSYFPLLLVPLSFMAIFNFPIRIVVDGYASRVPTQSVLNG